MKWKKCGLIYSPPFDNSWRDNSALTPTAFILNKDVIRVFSSFRDKQGIGRIGYTDVNSSNPSEILKISPVPVLNTGCKGMFDDNGVILGDVVRVEDEVYMYYVGFQLVRNVKFLAYTGLAISYDNGDTFKRHSKTPILDRSDEALYIRAIHSVLYENNKFKIWYATGSDWEIINDIDYPKYDINYIESNDGITFGDKGVKCIQNNIENLEYRIGRPRVYKNSEVYIMNFTYGTIDGRYQVGQASSNDGIHWIRNDKDLGIDLSKSGWDSKHLSYPSIIVLNDGKTYMFYNGNDMGFEGFGYAQLID